MSLNTFKLIPETVFGTSTENYDGASNQFIGVPQKAAGYYHGRKATQTVAATFDGFTGQVAIQGTLEDYPETDNWVDLRTIGETDSVPVANTSSTIIGNFVWIRATVSGFTGGTITSIDLTY